MHKLNPFRYGEPVPPDKHINRAAGVQVLFSRLVNSEATALVGEPHIGKSSLIRYIQHPKVRENWLEAEAGRYVFVDVDCHQFSDDCTPGDLWKRVMGTAWQAIQDDEIRRRIDFTAKHSFDTYLLEQTLREIDKQGWRVVLLLDEFERVLRCSHLFTPEFLGALRSLASRTDSLIPVIVTRRSLAALNRAGRDLIPFGSPPFNNCIEVTLSAFSKEDVRELVTQSLVATDVHFNEIDMHYLSTLAGGNPYLVQMAAACLFDEIVAGKQGAGRYLSAATAFYRRSGSHFDDFWENLDPAAQTALVILAMSELKGRVDGRNFDTGDIGALELFSPELERLAEQGLVIRTATEGRHTDLGNWVFWQGEAWRVAVRSFVWWVTDNVITRTRRYLTWEEWLEKREYEGILTRHEKEKLSELVQSIPKPVVTGAVNVGKMLLAEILKTA
jgi:hypothetical protein